jgi:hypothetical protein
MDMEPISAIVLSLALGAAAEAGKATVAEAVKDAYAKVKQLLRDKFSSVPIDLVTQSPASEPRRALVAGELTTLKADQNQELVEAANKLIEVVKEHEPSAAAAIGVNMKDVEAANIRLSRIVSSGSGVVIERAKATGDIVIEDVQAGVKGHPPKNG